MEQEKNEQELITPEHHKHHPHLIDEDMQRLKNFNNQHGRTVTTILMVILIAIIGFRFISSQKTKKSLEASTALASASSVQDFEAIVEKYKNIPSAPVIKLQLAKLYFDSGTYDMAITTYNELKDQHTDTLVGIAASLGIANCLEARGQLEDALQQFDSFISNNPDNFLEPQAILGKARLLDILGRTAEAKELVEKFIVDNQGSDWVPPADEVLKELKSKLEKVVTVVAPPVAG